jgi:hypothetical protein
MEAYCRQHLLNMQVTFQGMRSGGKGRTENMRCIRWTLHHRKYALYFHGKDIKKSAADRQSDNRCSW